MSFFRNPEIRQTLFAHLLLAVALTGTGFWIGREAGFLALAASLLFAAVHFAFTYRRYQKIAALSREIDSILHGKESIDLHEYSEGELAILQSEIYKLTIQLREQADALQKDKVFLADSIADISHQIKTPLTAVNLLVSRLSNPELTEPQKKRLLKEIEMLLSRIDWLISALLKMAKLDAKTANLQQQTVPVAEVIKRAAATLAVPMELREQQLHVSLNGDETFTGDLSWSVEAIANILKNCMDHTPNGGEIHVSAHENAIFTEITISDNGCGIDEKDLPHIFERFYKGRNSSSQNIGIGLALARAIITNQNGTIKAENNPTGGARFTVRLYKGVI